MSDKLSKEFIGRKHLGPKIDITDPCYDRDTWCRLNNIDIVEGEYDCYIWNSAESYEFDGEKHEYTRVGRIGIYLDNYIPHKYELFKIGNIGVDAGLAGFFMDKPDYTDAEWTEFCNELGMDDAWIRDEGFFSSSGYGDGYYPVYAANNNDGKIIAVEIAFM